MEDKSEGARTTRSKPQSNKASIKVTREVRRRLAAELGRINRKSFGRKVTVSELVGLLVGVLTEDHVRLLREASMSNSDRLERQFRDYAATHGGLSRDDFIGKLLAAGNALAQAKPASENTTGAAS